VTSGEKAASAMLKHKIGIICEDQSDYDVLKILIGKANNKVSFVPKFGHGCSRIRAKADSWVSELATRGCRFVLIVHDLDSRAEPELRSQISRKIHNCATSENLIVIPVRELEAWLLSDGAAINKAFELKESAKDHKNPESIDNPKEYIEDLVWRLSEKRIRYINTVGNARIAKHLQIDKLKSVKSFQLMNSWVRRIA